MKVSIIIPTYNELCNLKRLVIQLNRAVPDAEIVIVDDNSPDGTGRLAEQLAASYPIITIHRPKKLGLASAIAAGFNAASGDVLGVMDSDFSHPISMVPKLIAPILDSKADIVIGSRFMKGSKIQNWPISRKITSRLGCFMAGLLTNAVDPLSGFFFLKKDSIRGIEFKSKGYKILLEVLVKGRYHKVIEVPIIFKNRLAGSSKLNALEYLRFILDWYRLVIFKYWPKRQFQHT